MCGIAGYFGNLEMNPGALQNCIQLMKRRGPDADAIYQHSFSNQKVYLLHSRLSIIDLESRANQPFRIGSKLLIFNGELYNYLELKEEFKTQGHTFVTDSDTEVLLKTIIHYGWKGLDKCEGMWALAIYDEKDGSLLLSRDRFGEKPLYFYRDHTGIYFASEVKLIFSLLERKLEINYDHLYRFLVNGYKSLYKVNDSFFQEVRELKPAYVLKIESSGIETEEKYWHPKFNQDHSLTYAESVEGVREVLIRSVKQRLRSDVPVVFCMSGGIDSNSLISIAKNVLHYDVHGFTIVNEDERYAEQELVDHAVAKQGLHHTPIPIETHDFLPKLLKLVNYHDAPVHTIAHFAHWLLMERIADHGYRTFMSGVGADELFSGYFDHYQSYLAAVNVINPDLFKNTINQWKKHIKPVVRNPHLKNPRLFIDNPKFRDHIYLKSEEFSKYFYQERTETFFETVYCQDLMRNRMANEMFGEVVPVILHEEDLNAMYYSLENRAPYLDRQLFELCQKIPTKYLIQRGFTKVVLRDAMRGIVPEKILNSRRKVGFNAPIFSFLDVQAPEVREYLLDQSPIFEHIRREKIEELLSQSNLPNSESKFLFCFLTSKMFLEGFIS